MNLTEKSLERQINLSGEAHVLVSDATRILNVSERQIYRWLDDGILTRRSRDTGRGICIPVAEVMTLKAKREERRNGQD